MLTLEKLGGEVASGRVDTVIIAMCDMQGRLQGKRL
jgi:glutamine synthetase